jgi:hypothetical protein
MESYYWEFMLVLEPETTFPPTLTSLIANTFSISCQEADAFLSMIKSENQSWLYPEPAQAPELTHLHKPLIATSSPD